MRAKERDALEVKVALAAAKRTPPKMAPHYLGAWRKGYLARLRGEDRLGSCRQYHKDEPPAWFKIKGKIKRFGHLGNSSIASIAFRRAWECGWDDANEDMKKGM